MNQPAAKMALCISAHEVLTSKNPGVFHTFMMDRAIVDNPNFLIPGVKQLLPYVTLYSKSRRTVLTYLRGKAGTEIRLRARSIGFGGHVDTNLKMPERLPGSSEQAYGEAFRLALAEHLAKEAIRELNEELPGFLNLAHEEIRLCLIDQMYKPKGILDSAIDVRYAEVDKVHLGIALFINVDDYPGMNPKALEGEENQVEDLRWEPIDNLIENHCAEALRYEGWSQYMLFDLTGDTLLLDNALLHNDRFAPLLVPMSPIVPTLL